MNERHIYARRRFLKTAGALLAAGSGASLLAACQSTAPSGSATAAPAAPAATTAPATAASKPVATTAPAAQPTSAAVAQPTAAPAVAAQARPPAGELKVVTPEKVVSLDVQGANSVDRSTHTYTRHVLEALVTRDPTNNQLVPELATQWTTPDPNTWIFTLRKGVKFQDGADFTSADVKASLERTIAQKGPVAPLFAAVDTVDASDPATVRIQTKSPVGTLLSGLSLVRIAPAAKLSADGFWNKPIGTAPFRVVSWQPDAQFQLEANPDYWGPPPGVKSLTFRDIPELAARVTAIDTGEIDLTFALPPDQIAGLQQNQNLKVDETKTFSYYFIWFNHSKAPFTDMRVRQALWYALDIDTIIKDLFSGIGQRAQAPIPSTVFGFAAQTPYAYDPAKAKQLLSDAGHPDGIDVDMIWNPGGGPQDRELAQALLSAWNQVGVRVKSREEERGIWLQDLLALNWDMDFQTNTVTTGDADFTLRRLYHSSAKRLGYANQDLDKILDDAVATLDQQQRQQLYAQANKIIWDNAVGIFPMELLTDWVQRKQLSGFIPPPNEIPNLAPVRVS